MNMSARLYSIFQPRISLVLLFGCIVLASLATAQQSPSSTRRIVSHTAPAYPSLARSMALAGLVKLEALVAPDGSVRAVDVKGGHPVLAQAATNTVRQWKWEPAPQASHELVEIRFSPPE